LQLSFGHTEFSFCQKGQKRGVADISVGAAVQIKPTKRWTVNICCVTLFFLWRMTQIGRRGWPLFSRKSGDSCATLRCEVV
jgi:hypothetical protein